MRFQTWMAVGSVLLMAMLGVERAAAQQEPSDAVLSEAATSELDESLATMDGLRAQIADLQKRVGGAEGLVQAVLERRLDEAWIALVEATLGFAEQVADHADAGREVARYRDRAVVALTALPNETRAAVARLGARVRLSTEDQSAAERAATDRKVAAAVSEFDRLYQALIRSLGLARRFELDVAAQEAWLDERVLERAANISVYLELTLDEVDSLRVQVGVLPDDTELKAELAVAEARADIITSALESVVSMMSTLELESSEFERQLIAATGEIRTVDKEVIGGLIDRWRQSVSDSIAEGGPRLVLQVALFLLIFLAFLKLAQLGQRLVGRGLESSKVQLSELLTRMVVSTTRNLIIIVGVLIALSQLGISLGPLLAGLGIAGFVIGFALQDSLSNFASGMMILLYRPFDVEDLVEAGGVFGRVSAMSLVNTTILTPDNQTLVVPNNKIWGDVIKNVTAQEVRRVDLAFGISYGDDISKAERILEDILAKSERVLDDPEPIVRLHELGESSVNFVVRPWVKTDDYWDVWWDVTRTVKMRFDEEGITIPFPQRDVHFSSAQPAVAGAPSGDPSSDATDSSAQTDREPTEPED